MIHNTLFLLFFTVYLDHIRHHHTRFNLASVNRGGGMRYF